MTRRSNSKKFKVFDFDDDDRSENLQTRFSGDLRKMRKKNKKRDDSPINKYHFLQSFARGTEIAEQGFRDEPGEPIDVDTEGCQCTYSVMHPKDTRLEDAAVKMEISGLDAFLASNSSIHENEPMCTVSSESSNNRTSTSTTSRFCLADDDVLLEKQLIEPDCGGCENDNENMSVKIVPDFVLYGDISFGESCLTFSCGGIKLEALALSGTRKTLSFEWDITDIISIKSDWTVSVETAIVNLHLKSKTSKGSQNEDKTSGIEQLNFAVYDPGWAKAQKAIKRLDARYNDTWNINFDTDMVKDEKDLFPRSRMLSPKHYFCGSDEPFEDAVYPKGDPDAVTIHKRDIELLEPERFINDTIIDFYIKYLANGIQTEEKHRMYFFNCFFFRKLADLDKDPSSAHEGKAAFQRVSKWTRKVNLFEKDYIFIPVNYSLHWSLLVICYPGEVPNFKDEEFESASKVPCILHMDSIRGSHKGLKNLIRGYLCEEWKVRHHATTEDASSSFLHMKFVPLKLPQQENLFDCGLFLLHYVERFLEEALNFGQFNLTKFSNSLSSNWFQPEEASRKRYSIKKLIYEILQDHSQSTGADGSNRYPCAVPTGTSEQETKVIFLEKISSSTKACYGISSTSNVEQVGISLSKTALARDFRESGLGSKLFEAVDCSWLYTDANYLQLDSPCHRSTMTPIEEVVESNEKVAESPVDMEDCQQIAELETLGKHEISVGLKKLDERVLVSSRSTGSLTLAGVGINIVHPTQDIDGFDNLAEPEKQESSSTSCKELAHCVVPDSEEEDSEHDSNDVKYIPFICMQNGLVLSTQEDQSNENIILNGNNLPTNNEDTVSKSDEVKPVKRRKFKPP